MCSTAPSAERSPSRISPKGILQIQNNHTFHTQIQQLQLNQEVVQNLISNRSNTRHHLPLISSATMELKLRCSESGCECGNFIGSKERLRSCDSCSHTWFAHLFEKLLRDDSLSVFDVCSLALYGTHALPIRLKIVIERLLATLQPDETDKILRSFGWSSSDLARGYMIQDPRGGLISSWSMLPRDEEIIILQQFVRFSPTRSLSYALLRDDIPALTRLQSQPITAHQPQQVTPPKKIPEEPALNLSSSHKKKRKSRDTSPPQKQPPQFIDNEVKNEVRVGEKETYEVQSHKMNGMSLVKVEAMENVEPAVDLSAKRSVSEEPASKIVLNSPVPEKSSSASPPLFPKTEPKIERREHASRQQNWSGISVPHSSNSGKRRVQCSVCLKTFCDKGALKIHYSAVHLREQHRCTVAGCNMMFSSRRSRNRHSANPNPKLHSPHLRRRISPHDGRTAQPFIRISNNPLLGPMPGLLPSSPISSNGVKREDEEENIDYQDARSGDSSLSLSSNSEKSSFALVDEGKRDGARKRKLSNPVRLSSTADRLESEDFGSSDGNRSEEEMEENEKLESSNHLEQLESLPIFNCKIERNFESSGGEEEEEDGSSADESIPIDKENPRRCIACGKLFQNHFGVKTHYQNVHLKLMHKCTVEGCNAAFPSKRSRDRHSANSNLHRKLLSTTSDASNGSSEENHQGVNSRNNILQQATQMLQNSATHHPHHPHHHPIFNPFLMGQGTPPGLSHVTSPAWNPFLPFPLFPAVFPGHPIQSNSAHLTTTPTLNPSNISNSDKTECQFCGKNTECLSSHLENCHADEGLRCSRCSRLFFSKSKHDSHSCNNSPTHPSPPPKLALNNNNN